MRHPLGNQIHNREWLVGKFQTALGGVGEIGFTMAGEVNTGIGAKVVFDRCVEGRLFVWQPENPYLTRPLARQCCGFTCCVR